MTTFLGGVRATCFLVSLLRVGIASPGATVLVQDKNTVLVSAPGRAGPVSPDGAWVQLAEFPARTETLRDLRPREGQPLWLNWDVMLKTMAAAPDESTTTQVRASPTVLVLPRPDSTWERFAIVESSIMEPALRAKIPDIRTYLGQGLDNPAATVRLDRTPQGFHAQVLAPSVRGVTQTYYIDPVMRGDTSHYVSHWRGMLSGPHEWTCATPQPGDDYFARTSHALVPRGPLTVQRTTYRLAMAATGEYTTFASLPGAPNVLAGMSAIVTTVNRVTQLLENDCDVRLVLVADNLNIVYSDPATDPYSGTQGQKQAQNQATLDTVIQSANYDVGHLVDQGGGGGNAGGIGTVCSNGTKGLGYTASASPTGDAFWVDYVAHEIGHQIGATHTFNGVQNTCGTQWTSSTAYEPGSGTSIMGYAGICSTDNLATANPPLGASDPMYSFASIQQIMLWANVAPCGASPTPTANHHPVPVVSGSYTIPTSTNFSLVGSASDQDFGNSISYSWEQADRGAQRPLGPDTGAHEPLFRTYMHASNNERIFPTLNPLTGAPMLGENLPLFARSSEFKLVVRDNVAGGGGIGFGSVSVTFAPSTNGGFRVTQPAGGTYCAGQQVPVTWTVAGTSNPPVSCELVDITMSFDGGQTFPHTLAAGIANSGLALVTMPPLELANARIRVSAVGNVFFADNPGAFRVQTQPAQFTGFTAWPACSTTCPGAAVTIIPSPVSGSEPIQIALQKFLLNTWIDVRTIEPGDAFFFSFLTQSDSGNYRIAARNGCGTAYTAEHRINVGVAIEAQPTPQTVAPCAGATFSVTAYGACTLAYQWLRNGDPIASGGRFAGATSPTLTISGCRYDDEAWYSCRMTDECGVVESTPAPLLLTTPVWEEVSMSDAPRVSGGSQYWCGAYDERRGTLVMYGGMQQGGQNTNSLWEYDGYTWTARQDGFTGVVTTAGQPLYDGYLPPCSQCSAMVYNPDDQKVYLIAHYSWQYPLMICTWDGAAWTRPYYGPVAGDSSRTYAVYDRTNHRIVIVRAIDGSHDSEMLLYDPATNIMTGPAPMQPQVQRGVHDSGLWYDELRGSVFWYNNLNQFVAPTMWRLGGSTWQPLDGTPFSDVYGMQFVYDPIRKQVAAMGGYFGSASYYTGTHAWPAQVPGQVSIPSASAWMTLLPDGPPRNPAAAGISPSNNWNPMPWNTMAFDRKRRAMVAPGLNYTGGPLAWRTYERRYRDAVVFDKPAASEVLAPGNVVRINSYAAGTPGLTYQWRKDGVPLASGPAAGGGTISGAQSGVLTITGVGPADEGGYVCTVTNPCGSAASSVARLGCVANFDHAGGVSVQDIFAFLAAWFNNDPSADVNGQSGVTVQDIFDFLSAWFTGC